MDLYCLQVEDSPLVHTFATLLYVNGSGVEGELSTVELLPIKGMSTVVEPNLSSTTGAMWVKISDKWREVEIVTEGKRIFFKWVIQQGKSSITQCL